MPSIVEVCNMALSAVGTQSTIASLTENSNESNALARWLPTLRDLALRTANWQFARKQQALPLLSGAPDNLGWDYVYGTPSDMVKARFIPVGTRGYAPFQMTLVNPGSGDVKAIATGQEDANLVYTARVANPDLWDPAFIYGFSILLGSGVAIPLTGDKTLRDKLAVAAKQALVEAATMDANESGPEVIDPLPDWLAVRDGYMPFGADYEQYNYYLTTMG